MKLKGNKSIGLDASGNLVTLLYLEKHGKEIKVINASSLLIPPNLPSKEERDAATRETIGRLFENVDVKKAIFTAGLGGQVAFVRKLKLPPVPKGKIRQIVSYEVQQQIPFPLKEVVWDYHLSPSEKKKTASLEVTMAAVKGEMVENLVERIKEGTGKEPDAIDVSTIALHNIASFNNLLEEGTTKIIISINWNFTDILIEEGENLAFTRSIPIGEKSMIMEIMKKRGIEYEDAEKMAFSEEVDSVKSIWQNLFTEIKRTMNYYLSQVEKVSSFKKVIVHGRLSHNSHFLEFLSSSFRGEISTLDPWVKISKPSGVENGYYGISLGLALRPFIDLPLEVNLLPPKIIRKKILDKKKPYFILSGILIPFVGATFSAFSYQDYTINRLKLERVEKAVKSFDPYIPKITELSKKRGEIERKLKEIEGILSKKTFWSDFLREISILTPSDIYITEIKRGKASEKKKQERAIPGEKYGRVMTMPMEPTMPTVPRRREKMVRIERKKGNSFLISGKTKSFPRVDEYISRLQSSPLFEKVTLINVEREEEKVGFLLQINIKKK